MAKIICPNQIYLPKPWGSEAWLCSTLSKNQTFVGDMPLSQVLGEETLLVKIIEAKEKLSVQVHPDDIMCPGEGKTECWFILESGEDSALVYGLDGVADDKVKDVVLSGEIGKYLHYEKVKAGDFVFVPAGVVHAIGENIKILEIQQSADITYRVYDWGRDREIHVEKSAEMMEKVSQKQRNIFKGFLDEFECDFFKVKSLKISGEENVDFASSGNCGFFVVDGNITIDSENFNKGQWGFLQDAKNPSFAGKGHIFLWKKN